MASSKPGYILMLIENWDFYVFGVFNNFLVVFSFAELPGVSIWVVILVFLYLVATGGLTIWGGTLMRDPKTTEKGG